MAQAQVIITAVDKTGAAVNSAMGGMNKLGKSFSSLSAGVGSLLGVGLAAFFLKTAKEAIHLGDELQKAADKTGLSASKMSELAYVAKISDIELSSLSVSLKKMQVALSEAGTGSKGPNEALTALGLNFKELKSLAADQQFTLIAQRISELKDPADRARAATDLFGKSGADLLPLFLEGSEGIAKLIEEAHKLNAVLSDEQVRVLSDADKALKEFAATWDGFANNIVTFILPTINSLLNPSIQTKKYLSALNQAEMGMTTFLPMESLPSTVKPVNATTPKVSSTLATGYKKQKDSKDFKRFIDSLIVTPSQTKLIISAYEELLNKMNDATKTSIEKDVSAFYLFEATLEDLFKNGQITLTQRNLRMTEALNNALEEVVPTAKRVQVTLSEMSEYAKSAAQSIQSAFADFLFDPFQNGLRGMLAGFANIIRRMVAEAMAARIIQSSGLGAFLNAFMGVAVPAGVPAGGGGGGRGMALGGPVSANSTYMVGERGPEMFVPRSAGTIIPNNKMNGTTIAPVYNIDARGASADMQKALPAIMAENNRKIFDELDRRYGIGR